MKLPNSYGSISKLSGKRRKPYIIRKTTGYHIDPVKEKKVAESGHSGSALAVFTSPIPASCSRRRPKSLIAQLRAGLQKDKIEKERGGEREGYE